MTLKFEAKQIYKRSFRRLTAVKSTRRITFGRRDKMRARHELEIRDANETCTSSLDGSWRPVFVSKRTAPLVHLHLSNNFYREEKSKGEKDGGTTVQLPIPSISQCVANSTLTGRANGEGSAALPTRSLIGPSSRFFSESALRFYCSHQTFSLG